MVEFEAALIRWSFWALLLGILLGGKPWVIPGAGQPWLDRALGNSVGVLVTSKDGPHENGISFFTFNSP